MSASKDCHLHGFDLLRVVSILAVIYIHGSDTNVELKRGTKWLGFAVPCFFMMSAYLAQGSFFRRPRPVLPWLRDKLNRLAPPFYFWSVVYLLVRFIKSRLTSTPFEWAPVGWVFWGDASYQLYFVPMLFYCFAGWAWLMKRSANHRTLTIGFLICVTVLFIIGEPFLESLQSEKRWFIAKNLVWFPLGMLAALAVGESGTARERMFWPSILVLATLYLAGHVNIYAISFIVFVWSLSITRRQPKLVRTLATYSFGVYLVHVLLIETLQFLLPRLGWDLSEYWNTVGIVGVTILGSYAICLALGQSRWTRWSVT